MRRLVSGAVASILHRLQFIGRHSFLISCDIIIGENGCLFCSMAWLCSSHINYRESVWLCYIHRVVTKERNYGTAQLSNKMLKSAKTCSVVCATPWQQVQSTKRVILHHQHTATFAVATKSTVAV